MSRIVTVPISDAAAVSAQELAQRTNRRIEDVLAQWIDQAASDIPADALSDEQLYALCRGQMDEDQQAVLSELLARQGEGALDDSARPQLDELLRTYRRGLVRKAEAMRVAVARGLIAPLG